MPPSKPPRTCDDIYTKGDVLNIQRSHRASSPDATALFLRNIANTSVLSRMEEYSLARMVQRGLAADAAVEELSTALGRVPSDEEVAAQLSLPPTLPLATLRTLAEKARELLLQVRACTIKS